jgi:hypothetical protein
MAGKNRKKKKLFSPFKMVLKPPTPSILNFAALSLAESK